MEEWSNSSTTKRTKRDQLNPNRVKQDELNADKNQMWCGKCCVSHQPNEPCHYPDISKSLWYPQCSSRQNDYTKGCSAEKGTSIVTVYKKCGDGGHTQENCTMTPISCYKCGKSGYLLEDTVNQKYHMKERKQETSIKKLTKIFDGEIQ